jgi:hypothetical protein
MLREIGGAVAEGTNVETAATSLFLHTKMPWSFQRFFLALITIIDVNKNEYRFTD